MSIRRIGFVMVTVALPLMAATAYACPACNETIANTDRTAANELAAGYNASIYLMLGILAAVGVSVARAIVRAVRDVPANDVQA